MTKLSDERFNKIRADAQHDIDILPEHCPIDHQRSIVALCQHIDAITADNVELKKLIEIVTSQRDASNHQLQNTYEELGKYANIPSYEFWKDKHDRLSQECAVYKEALEKLVGVNSMPSETFEFLRVQNVRGWSVHDLDAYSLCAREALANGAEIREKV